jgi:hypothetical protein
MKDTIHEIFRRLYERKFASNVKYIKLLLTKALHTFKGYKNQVYASVNKSGIK